MDAPAKTTKGIIMPWQHRVVKRTYEYDGGNTETLYQIHEYFYNNGLPNPTITEEPVTLMEDSIESLRTTLERMIKCLDAPVLDWNDFNI